MSFVDASAIVAILNEKPGFEELEKRLGEAAGGGSTFRRSRDSDRFPRRPWRPRCHVPIRESRGPPSRLNIGDCFAYAAAKGYRLSLIYKGNDFSQTDLG